MLLFIYRTFFVNFYSGTKMSILLVITIVVVQRLSIVLEAEESSHKGALEKVG